MAQSLSITSLEALECRDLLGSFSLRQVEELVVSILLGIGVAEISEVVQSYILHVLNLGFGVSVVVLVHADLLRLIALSC